MAPSLPLSWSLRVLCSFFLSTLAAAQFGPYCAPSGMPIVDASLIAQNTAAYLYGSVVGLRCNTPPLGAATEAIGFPGTANTNFVYNDTSTKLSFTGTTSVFMYEFFYLVVTPILSTPAPLVVGFGSSANYPMVLRISTAAQAPSIYWSPTGSGTPTTDVLGTPFLPNSVYWTHIALMNSPTAKKIFLFQDGICTATADWSANSPNGQTNWFTAGLLGSGNTNHGIISNLRLIVGQTVYGNGVGGNFTPPSAPLSASTPGIKFLLRAPLPSVTPTGSPSLSSSPTRSVSRTPSTSSSTTPSYTPTRSSTKSASSSTSPTKSASRSVSPTKSASSSSSATRSPSRSGSVTRSQSREPSPSLSISPGLSTSPTRSESRSPSATRSESRSPSVTRSESRAPSVTPSESRASTVTRSETPRETPSGSTSSAATATASPGVLSGGGASLIGSGSGLNDGGGSGGSNSTTIYVAVLGVCGGLLIAAFAFAYMQHKKYSKVKALVKGRPAGQVASDFDDGAEFDEGNGGVGDGGSGRSGSTLRQGAADMVNPMAAAKVVLAAASSRGGGVKVTEPTPKPHDSSSGRAAALGETAERKIGFAVMATRAAGVFAANKSTPTAPAVDSAKTVVTITAGASGAAPVEHPLEKAEPSSGRSNTGSAPPLARPIPVPPPLKGAPSFAEKKGTVEPTKIMNPMVISRGGTTTIKTATVDDEDEL